MTNQKTPDLNNIQVAPSRTCTQYLTGFLLWAAAISGLIWLLVAIWRSILQV